MILCTQPWGPGVMAGSNLDEEMLELVREEKISSSNRNDFHPNFLLPRSMSNKIPITRSLIRLLNRRQA